MNSLLSSQNMFKRCSHQSQKPKAIGLLPEVWVLWEQHLLLWCRRILSDGCSLFSWADGCWRPFHWLLCCGRCRNSQLTELLFIYNKHYLIIRNNVWYLLYLISKTKDVSTADCSFIEKEEQKYFFFFRAVQSYHVWHYRTKDFCS